MTTERSEEGSPIITATLHIMHGKVVCYKCKQPIHTGVSVLWKKLLGRIVAQHHISCPT